MDEKLLSLIGCLLLFLNLCYYSDGTVVIPQCESLFDPHPMDKIDKAFLTMNTETLENMFVIQMISEECHNCDPQNVTFIAADEANCTVAIDTRWGTKFSVIGRTEQASSNNCFNLRFHLKDGGSYSLWLKLKTTGNSSVITCGQPVLMNAPSDVNIALYAAMGILVGLSLLWVLYKQLRKGHCFSNIVLAFAPSYAEMMDSNAHSHRDLGTPTNAILEREAGRKERLRSLDTFRGISLVIMMFVNYGGGHYWFFAHSKWNGLTVADLVFPWFIWIMGTAMAYSFQSLTRRLDSKWLIFWKILKRAMILFFLGLVVNSGGSENPLDFKKIRIMGVLQRFSLTYFIIATIHMFCIRPVDANQNKKWKAFRDILNYWPEWILNLVLVVLHLLITFYLQVDGCPRGYLGPGGFNKFGTESVFNCTGGAAGYIDRKLLGDHHVYHSPTCKEIYKTVVPFDPEGLLGTLMSCFTCFIGLQGGKILNIYSDVKSRVKRFLVWALVLGVLALLLCKASKDDGWIPINKNLWSLTFVFALSSMAFIMLTVCYLLIDVYKFWNGAPFYYPGMNSIVVYMCHEVFSKPFQTFWDITPESHAISLLMNIWDVSTWMFLAYFLFCHKIFVAI